MSTFENVLNIKTFHECRDETISRKVIGQILEAGRNSPSPQNAQTLEFIVVESDEMREALAELTDEERIEEAPTSIIVVSDIQRMKRRIGKAESHSACVAEASVAVQNMRLVANSNDIASAWIGGFDGEMVGQRFEIPDGKIPTAVVALAYTDRAEGMDHRFRLNQICYYDKYGHQVQSAFDGFEWKGLRENREIYGKKAEGLLDKAKRKLRKVL